MLDGPELSRAEETHLDFIIDEQDLALLEDLLQADKVFLRRDDITARPLEGLDVKGAEFTLVGPGIPDRIVFGVEEFLELFQAIEPAVLSLETVKAAETVRIGDEVRPVTKMAVAAPVAIARGDRCGSQSPPVVAAHEREARVLVGIIARELDGVLDRRGPADVKVNPSLLPEDSLTELRQPS